MIRQSRTLRAALVGVLVLMSLCARAQPGPDVEMFKQVMNLRLQKLMITGFTQRDVRFVSVQAGRAANGTYAFRATVWVRDYEPGYPKNRYYGRTCVGKLANKDYVMSKDDFGGWKVEGVMTPDSEKTCKNNLGEGISSIPVESLEGVAARAGVPAAAPGGGHVAASNASAGGALAMGEWACFGSGGRALIGMGFKVTGNGTYSDLDGGNRGRFTVNAGTLNFSGGHLDGQTGRSAGGRKFTIKSIECEPSR